MRLVFCLMQFVTAVTATCTRTVFELDVRVSDYDLYREFRLGPPTTYRRPGECAQHCARNTQCSTFSFNQGVESCQLYGDVMYSSVSLAQPLSGERYFVYRRDWCPRENGFFPLRAYNMCVKVSTDKLNYADSRAKCEELGARLIVLEDEDKANAMLNAIDNLGLDSINYYVWVDDQDTEGVFLWGDGRQMVRNWWRPDEPNGEVDENCVCLFERGLYDAPCSWKEQFICEIIE